VIFTSGVGSKTWCVDRLVSVSFDLVTASLGAK
jgi:hypothetical protein